MSTTIPTHVQYHMPKCIVLLCLCKMSSHYTLLNTHEDVTLKNLPTKRGKCATSNLHKEPQGQHLYPSLYLRTAELSNRLRMTFLPSYEQFWTCYCHGNSLIQFPLAQTWPSVEWPGFPLHNSQQILTNPRKMLQIQSPMVRNYFIILPRLERTWIQVDTIHPGLPCLTGQLKRISPWYT